jgi:hypothetical protein
VQGLIGCHTGNGCDRASGHSGLGPVFAKVPDPEGLKIKSADGLTLPLKAMVMRVWILVLLFLGPVAGMKAQFSPQTQEQDDLWYIFNNYKVAVETYNGPQMVRYLDSNSVSYYEQLLDIIRYAGADELLETDFTSWYLCMYARFMAPAGSIEQMKEVEDLLGFLGKNLLAATMAGLEIQDIEVNGPAAVVYTIKEGQAVDYPFVFLQYADADWRFDQLYNYRITNNAMNSSLKDEAIMAAYGGNKKALLEFIIKNQGWDRATHDLWSPVLSK